MKTMSSLCQTIHTHALEIVQRYKYAEVELIEILQQADQHRVFSHLGYSSLFKYATEALGLSPEVTYIFINVARKAIEVAAHSPKLAVPESMTYVNASEIIEEQVKILTFESPEGGLEKVVRVRVQLGMSEKLMLQLRRIQDLVSQKQRRSVSIEEALEVWRKIIYVEKIL